MIGSMGRKAEILLHLFLVLNEITMKFVKIIMWYAPFGLIFLIAAQILDIKDLEKTAHKVGYYMLTVISGLMLHCFVTQAGLYLIVTRKNPFKLYYGCLQVKKMEHFATLFFI